MRQEAKKSCKTCIGNMEKYCVRCAECFDRDAHMTKYEMNKIKKEMGKS